MLRVGLVVFRLFAGGVFIPVLYLSFDDFSEYAYHFCVKTAFIFYIEVKIEVNFNFDIFLTVEISHMVY